MSNRMKVNMNSLKKDIDMVQTELNIVKQRISKMRQNVWELNQMWEGGANAEFKMAFEDDITTLEEICGMLEEVVKMEITAKNEYDTCEKEIASLVESINI